MRVSKALLLSLLLVSCSRGVDEVVLPPDLAATFVVEPLTAPAEEAATDPNFKNLPTARLINFTACLKDVAAYEPVQGASFVVKNGDQALPLKSSVTDSKGCLYWSERFSFDVTQQETYFEIERSIEAASIHKGRVSLRLAVNPWKKGREAVKDLRVESAPATLRRIEAPSASGTESALLIENVSAEIEIVRSKDAAAEANLQLGFEPKLKRLGLDGNPVNDPLTSGKFRVRVQLFAYTVDSLIPLTEAEEFSEGGFQKASVQMRKRIKILRKIPREASLELSFEATPVDAPAALKPVRGRVSIGRLSSLTISKTAPLRIDPNTNFVVSLPAVAKPEESAFGFELGKVRVTDVTVKALDGTGRPKALTLQMLACLANSVTQEKILKQEFRVQLDGNDFVQATGVEDGCVRWPQEIAFDFHARETPLKKTLTVTGANPFYGEQKVERVVYVNPWRYETKSDTVSDELFDGPPPATAADSGSGSEMVISSAFFNFMDRTFQIDEQLNLTTTRTFRFELTPKIRRLSRDKGWMNPIGTGNGRYLVKFLLETIDPNSPRVVDARTVEVESRADVMTATVDFHVDDIRLVTARLNLSIEVVPIGGATALLTKPYIGTFDMLSGFAVRLEPRAGRIDDRMKIASRYAKTPPPRAAELFARTQNHQFLDDGKLKAIKSSGADLDKFFGGDASVLAKYCALFFDPNGWFSGYKSCAADPEAYLAFAKTEHVRKILDHKLSLLQVSSLSLSAGVSYDTFESTDESKSQSRSYSVNSSGKLSIPLLELLGLEIGVGVGVSDNWNSSSSYTKGQGTGSRKSSDQSKTLYVDQPDFDITAELDRCLVVAAKSEKKKRGYVACGATPVKKTFREHYFLIHQPVNMGPVVDAGAPISERPFIALVRGQQRFDNFKRVLQDPEATLKVGRPIPVPAELMREAERRYDGFFPGLLTLTE